MKKNYVLFFILLNLSVFSQSISISPLSAGLTVDQLVNDVFISNNCDLATNIQTQGTCGIGYFTNNNGAFSFQEGIVLRNGTVALTEGSYTGSNLSSTCSGMSDADVQAYSNANGATGTINDVTSLSFDFISASSLFSFDFIFASNEYGQYQCGFGDFFIFLLTDLSTGVTQNLAVVPGTNDPVSVTSIRDNANNNGCASMNPLFFGTYNVGNPNSVMNMRGYTQSMTASAFITPNAPYRIKIAIGDYMDSSFDSAIFIEAGSINNVFNSNCIDDAIKLTAFLDENENGIKEVNEPLFTQGNFVHTLNTGNTSYLSSSFGVNYIVVQDYNDFHDITYQANTSNFTSTNSVSNFQIVQGSGVNEIMFPIVESSSVVDVSVVLSPFVIPVVGSQYKNVVTYTNNGAIVANGTVTYNVSNNVSVLSTTDAGATINPTGFSLNYSNLQPQETRTVEVNLDVLASSSQSINASVQITSDLTETNSSNNQHDLTENISLMPLNSGNYITEAHGYEILVEDFTPSDYLYYTIHFQNQGTSNVANTKIMMTLSGAEFDVNSIETIASSSPFTLKREGGVLEWSLEAVNLYPKMVDEANSVGFLTFKVKPITYYNGLLLSIDALAYFDFDTMPISLGSSWTEFISNLSADQFENENSIVVYPNPFSGYFTVNVGKGNIKEYSIIDINGRVIKKGSIESSIFTIETNTIEAGIYFLLLEGSEGKVVQRKLIKN